MTTIRSFQENSRNLYVLARRNGADQIFKSYQDASKMIASQVLASPYTSNRALTIQLLSELNDTIDRTIPYIESEFRNQVNNVVVLGGNDSTGWLSLASGSTPINLIDDVMRVQADTISSMFSTGSPIDNKVISEKIWDISKKTDLLKVVREGQLSNKNASEIANDITRYMNTGSGYSDAYRLAYTELTWGYETTRLDSARTFNDENLGFEIAIEQRLSPNHKIYDICDELQGVYRVDQKLPAIPRHPNCACVQRQKILKSNTKTVTYADQLSKIRGLPEAKAKAVNTGSITLL